ncbi:MAG TPA: PEGA domain-containing protein [Terriglobia bacterium]|nr:PEGA domain-containing protein [Terriglobia bacterium]
MLLKIGMLYWCLWLWASSTAVFHPLLTGQQTPARTLKLTDGTPVRISLEDNLSSKTNKAGDPVHFKVWETVKVGEVIVIPAGAPAVGHVFDVGRRGFVGRSGKLGFSADSVKIPGGATIKLRGSPDLKGGSNGAVTAAATAVYGPGALFMRGWDLDLRTGTRLNAYVDGDTEITVTGPAAAAGAGPESPTPAPRTSPTLERRPAPPSVKRPEAATPSAGASTVVVKSTPSGADIAVDNNYVGSTPSTFKLPPGEHVIAIAKPGFLEWQRHVTITAGGDITVDATLTKAQ